MFLEINLPFFQFIKIMGYCICLHAVEIVSKYS